MGSEFPGGALPPDPLVLHTCMLIRAYIDIAHPRDPPNSWLQAWHIPNRDISRPINIKQWPHSQTLACNGGAKLWFHTTSLH